MAFYDTVPKYDIFINYLRRDRRSKTFADRLNAELKAEGFSVFLDEDQIRPGQSIEEKTKRALHTSRLFVPVISKSYATSPEVLDELEKIMEIRDIYARVVIPIFLDDIVDTSDFEDVLGIFTDALTEHRVKYDGTKAKLNRWRRALTKTLDLRGMFLKDRKESEFIKDIVEVIKEELNRTVTVIDSPFTGNVSRFSRIIGFFRGGGDEQVRAMVGRQPLDDQY